MKEKKVETFIYKDLGFPIRLINVPMKKIFGEWFLDINLSKLQIHILNMLIHKPIPLTGAEIRFIRKYFEMTTSVFGNTFGATHVAVLKWEKDEARMNPATEVCIRLFVLDRLRAKDKEFRNFYHEIRIENLNKYRKDKVKEKLFEIDANDDLLIAL